LFSQKCGAKHAIALNSCTAALQLALISLGVQVDDEVVMPALTFVAGANCVRQLGARPIFADVDPITLCITPPTIDALVGPKTKVIMTMNYGGQPVGIGDIVRYAKSRNVAVLEDAAHAVGTLEEGLWPGARSDAAAYSFYATKNVTSAEGGMLVTNRDDIAERVHALSLHGMNRDAWDRYTAAGSWAYDVTEIGYKCNMSDMAAALGMSQLRKLERLQSQRDVLASSYIAKLDAIPGVDVVTRMASGSNRNSWCLFVITIDEKEVGARRDQVIEHLRDANIGTSVHFIPTYKFSAYRAPGRVPPPSTERIWQSVISLPLYPTMTLKDVSDVVDALSRIVNRTNAKPSVDFDVMRAN